MGFTKLEKCRRGAERLNYPAVSLYAGGWLYFNREAVKLFDGAEYVELAIDQERMAIGFKPVMDKKEFKFRPYGSHGNTRAVSFIGVLNTLNKPKSTKFTAELKREGNMFVFEIPEACDGGGKI